MIRLTTDTRSRKKENFFYFTFFRSTLLSPKKTKKDISNLSLCFVPLPRGKDIPKYYTYILLYLWETSIKMSVRVVLSLLLSKKRDVFYCKWNIIYKFATSEGRNPWVKNAFLALSRDSKSGKFQLRGMRTMQRSFCLYIHTNTALAVPHGIYDSVGYLFLSSFLNRFFQSLNHDERDKSLRLSCIR